MNRWPGSFNFNEKEVLLIDFIDTIIYIYEFVNFKKLLFNFAKFSNGKSNFKFLEILKDFF